MGSSLKAARSAGVHLPTYLTFAVAVFAVLESYLDYASGPTDEEAQPRDIFHAPASASPDKNTSVTAMDTLMSCLEKQHQLTYMKAVWPGMHPLCVLRTEGEGLTVYALPRKTGKVQTVTAESLSSLLEVLTPTLESDYGDDDPTIEEEPYEYEKHPWKVFTPQGESISAALDLSPGDLALIYEGGQFIWPGWELGHVTRVNIPLVDDRTGKESFRTVEMTTVSLRPLAFEVHGLLADSECEYVKDYAATRLVRSRLAFTDGSDKADDSSRTSEQVFMPRGASPTILQLEHRAHNLTRLPYELGENLQVLRYLPGQKYGAHRDYFSPNDYHKQAGMLDSVEYGARNRLATVFWYMTDVDEGGETYMPRALNAEGLEYKAWNGDHNDCYRGIAVKPVKGNAVLFYGMLPDGRLDERSLHGGCPPRGDGPRNVKWGVNQWIWNQPKRFRGKVFPRKEKMVTPGCEDTEPHCKAWKEMGECDKNPAFMNQKCKASCRRCQ